MKTKLYSWFDVEQIILQRRLSGKWPKSVARISVYSDVIEVIAQEASQRSDIIEAFSDWFGSWFDQGKLEISLEAVRNKSRSLPVCIEIDQREKTAEIPPVQPTFSRIILYPEPQTEPPFTEINSPHFPNPWEKGTPPLIAFYSFKGGVGRTLHLTALAKVLSERQPKPMRLLIVDADLEAPGLTWWARKQGESPEVSLLDFLALTHYDLSQCSADALELVAERLREIPLSFNTRRGNVQHFFLPAFRDEEQLLRMPIRPEDLGRTPGKAWAVSDYLVKLGKILEVDAVLTDLRAGLSELASPILFDPRVIRVLLTTLSNQSEEGTRLILKQIRKFTPIVQPERETTENYFDPEVIFSMVPEELRELPRLNDLRESFYALFPDMSRDAITPPRLTIEESYFAQELLSLDSLESALERLSGTSVERLMAHLADDLVPSPSPVLKGVVAKSETQLKQDLKKLADTCRKFEFAESGEGKNFLRTPSLRNLGQRFQTALPVALVIGSKGAGKTFLYLQLARLKNWQAFQKALNLSNGSISAYVWPLLSSANLQNEASRILEACRQESQKALKVRPPLTQTAIKDRIQNALKNKKWQESDWRRFWLRLMAESLPIPVDDKEPLVKIHEHLVRSNQRIVFIMDGLEDLFQEIDIDDRQKLALRALLVDVPQGIRELRSSRVGVVIFIRRDLVKAAVKQNFGQLEALYQPFELRWDQEEALRLAAWVCTEASLTDHLNLNQDIEMIKREELEQALYPLWGKKLGKEESNEAYSANWVVSALSDFHGQLQARDMVRLLRYAADRAESEKPYPGRLLSPAAVRSAIAPCSKDKINEITQEFHRVKAIFEKFAKKSERDIPFQAKEFNLTQQEIKFLEAVGIILEEEKKYYIPEIFRHGLGFDVSYRARPKVIALLKKALARK